MLRTSNVCKLELSLRTIAPLATLLLAVFFILAMASSSARAADNPGQNNYGGRKLLTRVEPEYPADLRVAGIGGYVHLTVTITPNGTVASSEVVGGNPILAQSAMRAVARWKFSPAETTTSAEIWFHFAK